MRIFLISFYIFLNITVASAQQIDTKIILPVTDSITEFGTFLVDLAMKKHPSSAIYDHKLEIADLEIKKAKLGYWDAVLPFVSYSNATLPFGGGSPAESPTGMNGLAFGLSFRLAPLYTTEHNINIAKENSKIIALESASDELHIRNEVLSRYQQLLFTQKIVEQRLQVENDTKENQRLVLELFKQNGAEYEDVNTASSAYSKAMEDRFRAELEVKLAKLALEEWIGVELEEAVLLFGQ